MMSNDRDWRSDYTGRLAKTDLMKITEKSILERIALSRVKPGSRQFRTSGLKIGIGDDAAIWRPRAGHDTVLTCDWFLEGTHFLADRHPAHSVGWKCLARAVSDIAAMGGEPRGFLLSLALPKKRVGRWLTGFLSGLRGAARMLGCPMAGGDTTQRDEVLINVAVVGECRRDRIILRSGARPGDAIYVTGRLGEAEYGLHLARSSRKKLNPHDVRLQKHLYPMPRLEIGAFLARRRLATAMVDLSDGLSSDLPRLCAASGVGARIDQKRLPCVRISKRDVSEKLDATQLALHGGDDYELLFTVAKKNAAHIPKVIGRVALTQIGEITLQKKLLLADRRGLTHFIKNNGWDPFR
jgi:thiamine-monophosphate kinase